MVDSIIIALSFEPWPQIWSLQINAWNNELILTSTALASPSSRRRNNSVIIDNWDNNYFWATASRSLDSVRLNHMHPKLSNTFSWRKPASPMSIQQLICKHDIWRYYKGGAPVKTGHTHIQTRIKQGMSDIRDLWQEKASNLKLERPHCLELTSVNFGLNRARSNKLKTKECKHQ